MPTSNSLTTTRKHTLVGLRIAAAIASGVLCRLAIDPAAPWPALLFSWCLLILAVDRLSWQRAAALGLLQGLVADGLGFYWLCGGLREVLSLSAMKAAVACGVLIISLAFRSAIIAGAYRLAAGHGWPVIIAFPIALVSTELVYPAVFPWYTGHFGLVLPIWSQLAALGGPLAVSFWIALVNAGLAQAWLSRQRREPALTGLIIALATLAIVSVFGWQRLQSLDLKVRAAETARIGVVQGNLGPARLETRDPVRVYRDASSDLLRQDPKLDLIVWPETAVYFRTPAAQLRAFVRNEIWHASRPTDIDLAVPLLIGMSLKYESSACPAEPCRDEMLAPLGNSAVLVDQRGRVLGQYDKRVLMPFGESSIVPDFLRAKSAPREGFRAGSSDAALVLRGHRFGLSICYEDILQRSFRNAVNTSNPDLLINLTSDSWFRFSAASGLHMNLARLRAVEHGRFLLRATSTGVTSLIAPSGEIVWALPRDRATKGIAEVRWLREATLYEALGDWPWLLSLPTLLYLCRFCPKTRDERRSARWWSRIWSCLAASSFGCY